MAFLSLSLSLCLLSLVSVRFLAPFFTFFNFIFYFLLFYFLLLLLPRERRGWRSKWGLKSDVVGVTVG